MMKQNYILHTVTVSDGYAVCDCIPKEEVLNLTYRNVENLLSSMQGFILMVKTTEIQKYKSYQISLELTGIYHKFSSSVLEGNTAYTIEEDKMYVYTYKGLEELGIEESQILENLSMHTIEMAILGNDFLGDDAEQLSQNYVIYNVGAALCTAILNREQLPFFVYDMGCTITGLDGDYGKNFFMDIQKIRWLCISHRHLDHYNYFLRYAKKLSSIHLIVNDNFLSSHSIVLRQILLAHKLNGTLYLLSDDVTQKLSHASLILFSRLQDQELYKLQQPAHEHNIGLCIQGDQNILVTGDNVYDAFKDDVLAKIHVLCATHHGGKYWKSDSSVIPKNTESGTLVISASGQHYGHPSELEAYRSAGWNKVKMTWEGDVFVKF